MCAKLNVLDLTKNGVTSTVDYRQKVKVAVPNLLILDGFAFDDVPVRCSANTQFDKFDSSECSSSLISNLSKDTTDSYSDKNIDNEIKSPKLNRSSGNTDAIANGIEIDMQSKRSANGENAQLFL